MGMLLMVPDGNILLGAVVVYGGSALRTMSLRNTPASRASRSRGVQPSKNQTGRRMTLPPGILSCQTGRRTLPELMGVLTVRGVLVEG